MSIKSLAESYRDAKAKAGHPALSDSEVESKARLRDLPLPNWDQYKL